MAADGNAALLAYLGGMAQMQRQVQARQAANAGWSVASFEEFVLTRGRPYLSAPLSSDEEALVRHALAHALHLMQRRDFEIQQCYYNSQSLVLADHSGALQYVEGYAVGARLPFPIMHGWATLNDKVVDVTLRGTDTGCEVACRALADRVVGEFPLTRGYYGVPLPRDAIRAYMKKNRAMGSLIDDWKQRWPLLRGVT